MRRSATSPLVICKLVFYLVLLHGIDSSGQPIANYVANGSFEERYNCSNPLLLEKANYWLSIDSNSYSGLYISKCYNGLPFNNWTYQWPRTGDSYVISAFYWKNQTRGYLKNRLKKNLRQGQTYCVKFYVNICNTSPRGMDGFAAYFGDASIDTIKKTNVPLSYFTPQVSNPQGNVITDTLNWIPVTGTFVATGTEKYLVIGNFYTDLALTTTSLNSPFYPEEWTDVCIDDVSCIEMNVAAYAGPDCSIIPGDSVYIGRERDWAVDPYCTWYKLPNMSAAIDTSSGLWVKPTSTSTYVVRQELECNAIRWDTVVVHMNLVGLMKRNIDEQISVSPVSADTGFEIVWSGLSPKIDFTDIFLSDVSGRHVKSFNTDSQTEPRYCDVADLPSGIYILNISNGKGFYIKKKISVIHHSQ